MIILSRILILCVVALSCQIEQNKDKSSIVTFDLKKLPNAASIKLSDLGFVDIEYIPLESNEHSMISGTENLITRNKLVIWERDYIIQRFTSIL